MVNNGNYSLKVFKLITLIIVLLNLFCYASSANESKRDHKARFGTQWNRIGKRFEFTKPVQDSFESQESLDSQENNPQPSLIAQTMLRDELTDIYNILKNNHKLVFI